MSHAAKVKGMVPFWTIFSTWQHLARHSTALCLGLAITQPGGFTSTSFRRFYTRDPFSNCTFAYTFTTTSLAPLIGLDHLELGTKTAFCFSENRKRVVRNRKHSTTETATRTTRTREREVVHWRKIQD
uniref:Putative secreted protein n=1 Tax=Anopheles darlingi TaxID=43151 RepID=A0A2M4DNK3_ANODA